ncbi:unnamed protein product [Scytosiphon promiscuus]
MNPEVVALNRGTLLLVKEAADRIEGIGARRQHKHVNEPRLQAKGALKPVMGRSGKEHHDSSWHGGETHGIIHILYPRTREQRTMHDMKMYQYWLYQVCQESEP